ncbi:MAG TPA: PAS domain-containing protein [Solimonas sp.]|nr:PAS domain-containing protein [Solimonas sp.]
MDSAERLLREVTDNAPGCFYQLSLDDAGNRNYHFVSRGIEALTGYKAEEVMANPNLVFALTGEADRPTLRDAWAESLRAGTPYRTDHRVTTRSHAERWLRSTASPLQRDDGSIVWNGCIHDVTAELEAEQRAREAQARLTETENLLHALTENLPGCVYVTANLPDMWSYRFTHLNSKVEQIYGVSREEALADPAAINRLIDPDDLAKMLERAARTQPELLPTTMEFRFRKNGQLRWARNHATSVSTATGISTYGFVLDVTELKDAERRVQESEQLLRELTDNLPGLVYQAETVGAASGQVNRYTFLNNQVRQLYGISREQLLEGGNDAFKDLIDPDDWVRMDQATLDAQRAEQPVTVDYRFRRADGQQRWGRAHYGITRMTEKGAVVSGFAFDVTAEHEAQEKLAASQHLLGAITENLPGMVYVTESTGGTSYRFSYLNSKVEQVYGVSREEALADPNLVNRLIEPDDLENLFKYIGRPGSAPTTMEFRIRRDGQIRWIRNHSTSHPNPTGETAYGFLLDVTELKEAERRVRETEQLLREMTDTLPGFVYQVELEIDALEAGAGGVSGRYTYASQQAMQLYGVSREQLLQKGTQVITQLFEPEDLRQQYQALMDSMEHRQPLVVDHRFKRMDGQQRWARSHYGITRKSAKGVVLSGFTIDVTAEHEAEAKRAEAEQLLRDMTENLPGMVYRMEVEWGEPSRYTYISKQTQELYGISREEALRGNADVITSTVDKQDLARVMKDFGSALETGKPMLYDIRIRRRDGQLRWLSSNASVRKTDRGALICGFSRDVTAEHEMQAQLAEAKKSAEAANQAKGEFLANMSHEIRTPMNAIVGLSQLRMTTSDPEQLRDYLGRIGDAAQSLLGVINDILDFSKIEAGKLALERTTFELRTVLDQLTSLIGARAADKGLKLLITQAPDVPKSLLGDPMRLGQVLLNLAGNAVKFTEAGQIAVRVHREQVIPGGVRLRFEIADTGIGMSPQQLKGLFEAFTQADNSIARRFGGTGLGLSISKRLVELMSGAIAAESEHGKGSLFCFTADFGLAVEVSSRTPQAEDQTLKLPPGLRVLVVEDNESNQYVAKALIASFGVQPTIVPGGQEGITQATQSDFDVVLMDVQMPGVDGLTATRAIRALAGGRAQVPIIAMTANAMAEDRERCLAAGMDDYLPKPIDRGQLHAMLGRWAGRKSARTQAVFRTEASSPTTPPAAEGYDFASAERRLGGRKLLLDLARRFIDDESLVYRLSGQLKAGEMEAAMIAAHSLKSTAGTLGAEALRDAASELEQALKRGEPFQAAFEKLALRHVQARRVLDTLGEDE